MDATTSWGALPAEVGIYTAAELRTQWLALLAQPQDGDHVELDGSAVEQFDAAGAKAWITKPFNPPQLLDAVSKLILP